MRCLQEEVHEVVRLMYCPVVREQIVPRQAPFDLPGLQLHVGVLAFTSPSARASPRGRGSLQSRVVGGDAVCCLKRPNARLVSFSDPSLHLDGGAMIGKPLLITSRLRCRLFL